MFRSAKKNLSILPHGAAVLGLALSLTALVGCGGGSGARVSGKVTTGGQAVTGGTVTFVVTEGSGTPATGTVQSDGSYSLSTQGTAGATVGKNRITFVPPAAPPADTTGGKAPPPAPYTNLVPKPNEFDVKAGSNTVDIELVPAH